MSPVRAIPVIVLLAASAFAQEAKEKHLLRYAFEPGITVHYALTQEMNMTMSMGEETMVTTFAMTMFTTHRVKSVVDQVAEVEQEVTRVTVAMDNPAMKIEYDSDVENSDPGMLQGIEDLVGGTWSMKISDRGEVSGFQLSEKLQAAMGSSGMDLEDTMAQSVLQLPEDPIAIGDGWGVTRKMPLGQMGEADAELTFKLISLEGGLIKVAQTTEADVSEITVPGGMKLESVRGEGTCTLDPRTGMPREMDTVVHMDTAGQMAMRTDVKQSIRPVAAPAKKEAAEPAKDEKGDQAKDGE